MKKIIVLSLIVSGLLAVDFPLKMNGKIVMDKHPLPITSLSQESGGSLSAIDAYQDGIGVLLGSAPSSVIQLDNSALNILVHKYGEAAKAVDAPLKSYVLTTVSDTEDIRLANLLEDAFKDGDACDDNNDKTENDKYVNGECIGNSIYTNILIYGNNRPSSSVLAFDYIRGFDINGNRLGFSIIATTPTNTFWLSNSNGKVNYNESLKNSTQDNFFIYGIDSMFTILKFNGELYRFEIKGHNGYTDGDLAKVILTDKTSILGISEGNLNDFGETIIYKNGILNSSPQSYILLN